MDSDDYVARDYVERYVTAAESAEVDVVIGGYTRDEAGKLTEHRVSDSVWSLVTYSIACAKLFKRSFIVDNSIDFSDIRKGEDIHFGLCLCYHGASWKVINYSGYHYFCNASSTTKTLTHESGFERTIVELFDAFLARHKMEAIPESRRNVIEYAYVANMLNAMVTYGHGCGVADMKSRVAYMHEQMKRQFPSWVKNPLLFPPPKGQTKKIGFSVAAFGLLRCLRIDDAMFYVLSLF